MLHNFHTHTYRNRHASGTERAYIEAAIACGLKTLGFSEHAPYFFSNGYVSWFHLQPDELEDYVNTILSLKSEYTGQIDILLGYEAEYYPAHFDDLLARIGQYPVDYLLLGQHFTANEYDGRAVGAGWDSAELLRAYVDQCTEALQTGCFTYFAHPDLFYFTGEDAVYEREMTRLCRAAKAMDIPLEINMLGLRDNRTYPKARFFKIAQACGCTITAGLDAHAVDGIYRPETLPAYQKLVQECGLTVTDTFPLRSPTR